MELPIQLDCIVFRYDHEKNQRSYTYAFLYMVDDTPKYICLGYPYLSSDGEYRAHFIPYENLAKAIKKAPEMFDYMEENLLPAPLTANIFGKIKKKQLIEQRTAELAYLAYIFIICYQENNLPNHALVPEITQLQRGIWRQIQSKYDVAAVYDILSSTKNDRLGQKLIPLCVGEVETYGDIRYKVWRELYVSSLVNELSKHTKLELPRLLTHFYIWAPSNEPMEIYDNINIKAKVVYSHQSSNILKDLERVRHQTFRLTSGQKEEYFGENFSDLSTAIKIPIHYIEQEMLLSGYHLCMVEAHVGGTFYDYFLQASKRGHDDADIESILMEYCVSLIALNHIGVIHGDLHLNNITIMPAKNTRKYLVGDKIYQAKSEICGVIIDWSRSFITSDRITADFDDLVDERITLQQRKRIIKTYKILLPEFYAENHAELKVALIKNYKSAISAFAAIDMLRIAHLLEERIEAKGSLAQRIRNIRKLCLHMLRHDVLKGVEVSPNEQILALCFDDFVCDATSPAEPSQECDDSDVINVKVDISKIRTLFNPAFKEIADKFRREHYRRRGYIEAEI